MNAFQRCCLMFARVALAGWIGGATLFVINGIRLVTSGVFDSAARDHLALIRFPAYYVFGFLLVGCALIALLIAQGLRHRVAATLIVIALATMLADYLFVYLRLEAMITPPGKPHPAGFETYHQTSMIINLVHVSLCLIAAMLISRPRPRLPKADE